MPQAAETVSDITALSMALARVIHDGVTGTNASFGRWFWGFYEFAAGRAGDLDCLAISVRDWRRFPGGSTKLGRSDGGPVRDSWRDYVGALVDPGKIEVVAAPDRDARTRGRYRVRLPMPAGNIPVKVLRNMVDDDLEVLMRRAISIPKEAVRRAFKRKIDYFTSRKDRCRGDLTGRAGLWKLPSLVTAAGECLHEGNPKLVLVSGWPGEEGMDDVDIAVFGEDPEVPRMLVKIGLASAGDLDLVVLVHWGAEYCPQQSLYVTHMNPSPEFMVEAAVHGIDVLSVATQMSEVDAQRETLEDAIL